MTFSASSKKHHIIPAVMSMHTPTVWAKMTTVSHSILEDAKDSCYITGSGNAATTDPYTLGDTALACTAGQERGKAIQVINIDCGDSSIYCTVYSTSRANLIMDSKHLFSFDKPGHNIQL